MRLYILVFLFTFVRNQINVKPSTNEICRQYTQFIFWTDGKNSQGLPNIKFRWTKDVFETDDDAEF